MALDCKWCWEDLWKLILLNQLDGYPLFYWNLLANMDNMDIQITGLVHWHRILCDMEISSVNQTHKSALQEVICAVKFYVSSMTQLPRGRTESVGRKVFLCHTWPGRFLWGGDWCGIFPAFKENIEIERSCQLFLRTTPFPSASLQPSDRYSERLTGPSHRVLRVPSGICSEEALVLHKYSVVGTKGPGLFQGSTLKLDACRF